MIEKEERNKIIKDSIYIVIISTIIGFCINFLHPKGYILVNKSIYKSKMIVFISSEEAKLKLDGQYAVFIDSRENSEYIKGHITDAINIPASPYSTSVKKIKEHISILLQPRELVIYCWGTSCGSSEILANRLIKMGYLRHIYIIEHGFSEWKGKGFSVRE